MLSTKHKLYFSDSRNLNAIKSNSVNLVVTSPPYPMIEMWDELFSTFNPEIMNCITNGNGIQAFELMHIELDKVWSECFRVLDDGGIACINIGDATRSINNSFQLYSNHSRIINKCLSLGFSVLPVILWRKQTNAPNKFMGSGMLPVGAYVTLEHEYILILRKGTKREFKSSDDKLSRKHSAFFWEERNIWFSDIWDFKGVKQNLNNTQLRNRSGAFPFELAYRLINMYSVQNDYVLDPFIGTGTSMLAAIASCRNSIGVEIDDNFSNFIYEDIEKSINNMNLYNNDRLNKHLAFVEQYRQTKGELKHFNNKYNFPVMTSQETDLIINMISQISINDDIITVSYNDEAMLDYCNQLSLAL